MGGQLTDSNLTDYYIVATGSQARLRISSLELQKNNRLLASKFNPEYNMVYIEQNIQSIMPYLKFLSFFSPI